MKFYLLLFFLFFGYQAANSQTIVDGYYITSNNDSVKTKIKVPKIIFSGVDVESLERKVKSVDSSNQGFEKFKPAEINGFGFFYKNKNYNFLKRPITPNTVKFFERIFSGSNASVYYYFKTGYRGAMSEVFIVEKENGEDLVLKNSMSRKKIKNSLINFFSATSTVQQTIKSKPISKRHLENSVKEIVETVDNS